MIGALEARKSDVSRFVREAGRDRRDHGHAAATTLAAVVPRPARASWASSSRTWASSATLATAQQPVLRDLAGRLGDLDTFLTRLRPVRGRRHARPSRRSATPRSWAAAPCARARQEIHELRLLAKDAPGLAKPLRQFLQTIDQRDRAVEPDARAAATDPPAPDKTHISGSGGFTGMEAIWNYFYWQALGTNALDDVGHVLRLGVIDPTRLPHLREQRRGRRLDELQPVARPDAAGRDDARPDREPRPPRRRPRPPARRRARAARRRHRRPRSSTTCSAP